MALVKAAAEMARVVRPGGWMAAYMWDLPGGGFPLRPVAAALQSLGLGVPAQPGVEVSRLQALHALWQGAGNEATETRVIRITVAYADFDDFWDSISGPDGPSGNAIGKLPADARDRLKRICASNCRKARTEGSSIRRMPTPSKARPAR